MFWNKKKKDNNESEEDIYEYEGDLSDGDDDTETDKEAYGSDKDVNAYLDEEDGYDASYNGEDLDVTDDVEGEDGTDDEGDEDLAATVTVKVDSLNALAEFVALRRPLNLQFMKKGTDEVFELREAHFRIAKVWGTVSMSRECSAEEYAKIALATELLETPENFHVLPALTESDLKEAMADFCEEKYGVKSKKIAGSPKKFARTVEENGDKEEWKLFVKELLYKKTADFCEENGIIFSSPEEEETNE